MADASLDWQAEAIRFVFSWVVLMPIAVILSGKLLAQVLHIKERSKQVFRIRIPHLLQIQATDAEVIFGFTGFLVTLLLIALPAGPQAYQLFRGQFGIDPGQFNSLCVLSAFASVLWTAITSSALKLHEAIRRTTKDVVSAEHASLIDGLSSKSATSND